MRAPEDRLSAASAAAPLEKRINVNVTGSMLPDDRAIRQNTELAAKARSAAIVARSVRVFTRGSDSLLPGRIDRLRRIGRDVHDCAVVIRKITIGIPSVLGH